MRLRKLELPAKVASRVDKTDVGLRGMVNFNSTVFVFCEVRYVLGSQDKLFVGELRFLVNCAVL
jgi:hypothetical protein